ncbi:VIT1/CCC1 transporter family protein [Alistipes sp.]|uniref:VIT1/CCC1 transporter family protein n=1 Tax=Alistipes sp. TaxID=1872444 RepID=UPI003AF015BF
MNRTTKNLLALQRDEITLCETYRRLARSEKDAGRQAVFVRLLQDEIRHCDALRSHTGCEVAPDVKRVVRYVWTGRMLGPAFVARQMERREKGTELGYARYCKGAEFVQIGLDERRHGEELTRLAAGVRLSYMSSVVLGLNDALVEFTGALAGFTLALNDPRLVALTGGITGIAAALSMSASEYLSTKTDRKGEKHPLRAAGCTGAAYILTVGILIAPYLIFSDALVALGVMLAAALLVIALFNYYYAVVRRESFRRRFLEMAILSFGIAGISFLIGYLLKLIVGVDV